MASMSVGSLALISGVPSLRVLDHSPQSSMISVTSLIGLRSRQLSELPPVMSK